MSLGFGMQIGPCQILRVLPATGPSVYKARDTRLERTVAMKVIAVVSINREVLRERLFREARAASAFNQPHNCTIRNVGDRLVRRRSSPWSLAASAPVGATAS